MINKLRRKVTSKKLSNGGGIRSLPLPPSSPNVPQVFNQAPLFSKLGLQQRYASLPGVIRTPISKTGKFLGLRNPYMLGLYGLSYAAQNPTISNFMSNFPGSDFDREYAERMAKEAGPLIRAPGGTLAKPGLPNISGEADMSVIPDTPKVKKPIPSQLEKDFPNMSNSEIIESIEKNEVDSGLKMQSGAIPEIIAQAQENGQMEGINLNQTGNDNNQNDTSVVNEDESAVDLNEDQILTEINNRDNQDLKAKQIYFENLGDIVGGNNAKRSALALSLDDAVDDIMGPDNKKSKQLLLLQLASNLITGRTDQPGFKGFLDVLGQAGQNVIPMALSLEAARRDDEIELKKAMLANMKKKDAIEKFSADDKIFKVKIPFKDGSFEERTFKGGISENGNVRVKIPSKDGNTFGYMDITNFEYKMLDIPDADAIEKANKNISVKARALRGINKALKLTVDDPRLIGSRGTLQGFILRGADVFKQYFGETEYSKLAEDFAESKEQYTTDINKRVEAGTLTPEDAAVELEAGKNFFDNIQEQIGIAGDMKNDSTLRKQATLRATELLSAYALANILKDKDRLAVRDIERAETLTNQFGLFTSPTDVISRYLVIKKELEQSIADDLKVAESIGIDRADIANYDELLSLSKIKIQAQNKQFEDNLTKIIQANPDDLNKISDYLMKGIPIIE